MSDTQDTTISQKDAQRLINAIARQRDEHANARAQVEAALDAAREEIEELKARLNTEPEAQAA